MKRYVSLMLIVLLVSSLITVTAVSGEILSEATVQTERFSEEFSDCDSKGNTEHKDGIAKFVYTDTQSYDQTTLFPSVIADDEIEISLKLLPVMSGPNERARFFFQFLDDNGKKALEMILDANQTTSRNRLTVGNVNFVLLERGSMYELATGNTEFTKNDFSHIKITLNRPKNRLYISLNGVDMHPEGGHDISETSACLYSKGVNISKMRLYYYTTSHPSGQSLYMDELSIYANEKILYDENSLSMDFTAQMEYGEKAAVLTIKNGTDSQYLGQETELRLVSFEDESEVIPIASCLAQKTDANTASFSFQETLSGISPGWYYAEVIRKLSGKTVGEGKRKKVFVGNVEELMETDADSIAPSAVLNRDFVLPQKAPLGSQVSWSVSNQTLFDETGTLMPPVGTGGVNCTLTATLTYQGNSLVKEYNTLCYREPEYQLNGFLYRKPDGTTVRHMYAGASVIGADLVKNPRVESDATVLVGVYENGILKSVASGKVTQTGIIPLYGGEAITDTNNTMLRAFLWENMSTCTPLTIPKEESLAETKENKFYNTNSAVSDNGDDAFAAVDGNTDTSFCFSSEPETNMHKNSLYLYRSPSASSHPSVLYPLPQLSGTVVIEQSFLMTESELEKGLLYLYDQNENTVFSLIISGDILEDNKNHIAASSLLPYHWYHVRTELDFVTKTSDVYVNGAIGYREMPFRYPGTEISKLRMHNSADGESGIYIDNILILENNREYLAENFNQYEGETLPDGWNKLNQKSGYIGVKEFTDTELSLYPQSITIDTGRYSNLGVVSVLIPEELSVKYYLETSTDNSTYVRVASHLTEGVSGLVTEEIGFVEMRYLRLTVREAIDQSGAYCNGAFSEIVLQPSYQREGHNIADRAHITVSSSRNSSLDARGMADGIIARYARRGEWNAGNEANPQVVFSWDEPQTIDTVEIFGRLNDVPVVKKAELLFDDGTVMMVDHITSDGLPARVQFTEKQVNWIRLRLKDTAANSGLSEFRCFSSKEECESVQNLLPWKTVPIPVEYGGQWVVSDDIDGDGTVEFVSARGLTEYGSHETAAVCAFRLDGTVAWTWGTPNSGAANCGSDLACQIYDIDRDGVKEVLVSTRNEFVILNGITGATKQTYPLPACETHPDEWASDSIILADISGKGYPSDIIVKTRYTDVWAYTSDWRLIWHHCMPNGMQTAHAPEVIDLDHDGHDEVMAGFCFVDEDGSIISAFNKAEFELPITRGHVDSFACLKFEKNMPLSEMRFLISPCNVNNIFIVDGNGKKLWESDTDLHYETLISGNFTETATGPHFVTNPVHHYTDGEPIGGSGYTPIYFYDTNNLNEGILSAVHKGFSANRYLYAVNLNGKYDYVYQPTDHILFDAKTGETRARLVLNNRCNYASMRWEAFDGYHNDIDGDGRQDIVAIGKKDGSYCLFIYRNLNGSITASKLGTGYNYTYY